MKKIVILQSNYIPWKGYFDLIHDADTFIFHDDLQYTKNDWRNRNKIITSNGPSWLTIPTGTNTNRLICEVTLNDSSWQKSHWAAIRQSYLRAPFFDTYKKIFEEFYLGHTWENLSVLNQHMIKLIAKDILRLRTRFEDSRSYGLTTAKLERVLELVSKAGATQYISGPAAKDYIEEAEFERIGVDLVWKNYSNYPEYPQGAGPFEHGVSIIDLLFNVGPAAEEYIWGWREKQA